MKLIDANTVKRESHVAVINSRSRPNGILWGTRTSAAAAGKIYFRLISHSLCVAFQRAKCPDKI